MAGRHRRLRIAKSATGTSSEALEEDADTAHGRPAGACTFASVFARPLSWAYVNIRSAKSTADPSPPRNLGLESATAFGRAETPPAQD